MALDYRTECFRHPVGHGDTNLGNEFVVHDALLAENGLIRRKRVLALDVMHSGSVAASRAHGSRSDTCVTHLDDGGSATRPRMTNGPPDRLVDLIHRVASHTLHRKVGCRQGGDDHQFLTRRVVVTP